MNTDTWFADSDASDVVAGNSRSQEVPPQLVAAETSQSRSRAVCLNTYIGNKIVP
jgi:hypothetical protein